MIKLKQVEKMMLVKHLSVMLQSGIPISDALAALEEQARSRDFKKLISGISKEIKNGVKLEKALRHYPGTFDELFCSVVGIGEESGNLEKNLDYLAQNLAKSYEFKKKMKSAMIYPVVVLAATTVSGAIMAFFVLPKVVDMFKSLDVELPWTTKVLMWVADVFARFGVLIAIGGGLLILGLWGLTRLPKIKPAFHGILLRLPVFGTILNNIQVSNMLRNLGLMLGSGMPISETLEVSAKAADNLVYKKYLERLWNSVEKGKLIGKELSDRKAYAMIPTLVARMIEVGEKSGKLDEVCLYLAAFFEEETDGMAKDLATILEPVMLIVIAVMVGFAAFSIISPIYQLTGGIK